MHMELTASAGCPTPHTRIGMPEVRILGPGIVAKSPGAQITRSDHLVTVQLRLLRIGPGTPQCSAKQEFGIGFTAIKTQCPSPRQGGVVARLGFCNSIGG
jgi:hypothetical protein